LNNKIKILIADDHTILREGLAAALFDDERIEIIAKVNNGQEVLDYIFHSMPDIILMDINMPGMDGLTASKIIKKKYRDVKILILTMYDNKQFIVEALSLGIEGYILKMAALEELKRAILTIYNGEQYFDKELTVAYLSGKIGGCNDEIIYSSTLLTDRENEIISYIVNGYTSSEIAKKLIISPYTVNNHRRNIFRKLNINSKGELIKMALKEGLFKI
jgi:two-component system response regulator NreC